MVKFIEKKALPSENECEFDHGDVDPATGRVFVAHTSDGTVVVFDIDENRWIRSIPDCAGGSGVICDSITGRIFAASRKEGHILSIDPGSLDILNRFSTGSKPNGLAVDGRRGILMTADVGDNHARFHDQKTGELLKSVKLSGRPRWCLYRKETDEYLLNIMEPSGIEFISGKDFSVTGFHEIGQKGPHGLAVNGNFAYVACDNAMLVMVDLRSMKNIAETELAGPPDVLWYNSMLDHLYCSIGEPGTVQVFDGKTLKLIQQETTEFDCHTLTFDEKRQKLYTFLPQSHSIGIYDA